MTNKQDHLTHPPTDTQQSPEATQTHHNADISVQHMRYEGPIPPPSVVRAYEEILPGAADRILAMAEREQDLRKTENLKLLNNDRIKIFCATLISALLIVASIFLAQANQPELAAIIGLSPVLGGIVQYVLAHLSQTDHDAN